MKEDVFTIHHIKLLNLFFWTASGINRTNTALHESVTQLVKWIIYKILQLLIFWIKKQLSYWEVIYRSYVCQSYKVINTKYFTVDCSYYFYIAMKNSIVSLWVLSCVKLACVMHCIHAIIGIPCVRVLCAHVTSISMRVLWDYVYHMYACVMRINHYVHLRTFEGWLSRCSNTFLSYMVNSEPLSMLNIVCELVCGSVCESVWQALSDCLCSVGCCTLKYLPRVHSYQTWTCDSFNPFVMNLFLSLFRVFCQICCINQMFRTIFRWKERFILMNCNILTWYNMSHQHPRSWRLYFVTINLY